jgi:hypothetical protein
MDILVRAAFVASLTVVVSSMTSARADEAIAPSLARGIPSDAVFFLHWESAEKNGFAATHLRRVRQAVLAGGFIDRYVREYRSTLDVAESRDFEQQGDRWKVVLGEVPWWNMLSQECVVGARIAGDDRLEAIGIFRVGETRRDGTIAALRNVLYAIAGGGEGFELEVGTRGGVSTAVLYHRADYGEQLCVSGWRDVVVVSSSTTLARQTFHLLQGRGRDIGVVHADRYRKSGKALSKAVAVAGGVDENAASTGRMEVWIDPQRVFGGMPLLDVIESYHLVARMMPEEIVSDAIWSLAKPTDSPLLQALASQKSLTDLVRKLPASADAFSAAAGSNPVSLYDAFLEFAISATGDAELAERIERELSGFRVRLRADVLENLTGRRSTLSFRRKKKDASKPASFDHAYLFEVKDATKAAKTLETAAADVEKTLEAWNITFKKGDGDVYTLGVPLLADTAFVAVFDGFVVIATSPAALEEVRAVSVKGAPSVATAGELDAVPPDVDLDSVSRGSWKGALETAAWTMRALGLVGTLLPDDGIAGALKPLCVAVPKLIPAVEAFDFLGETGAYSTRDGRRFYARSRTKLHAIAEF